MSHAKEQNERISQIVNPLTLSIILVNAVYKRQDIPSKIFTQSFHEPTVKGPTHGVSYLNHSNPLFHVQVTPSLTSLALGVNFQETLGSMWFKSYLSSSYPENASTL